MSRPPLFLASLALSHITFASSAVLTSLSMRDSRAQQPQISSSRLLTVPKSRPQSFALPHSRAQPTWLFACFFKALCLEHGGWDPRYITPGPSRVPKMSTMLTLLHSLLQQLFSLHISPFRHGPSIEREGKYAEAPTCSADSSPRALSPMRSRRLHRRRLPAPMGFRISSVRQLPNCL
jgi:hypothetical protein